MNIAVRTAVVAAAAALALTGCTHNPSVAATVDGVAISERAVQQATDALVAAFDADPSDARDFAVNRTIHGQLAERIAADNGITITEADRVEVLNQQPQLAALAQQPHGKALADDWIDITVVAGSLGTEKLLSEVAKHPVTVNPRYGAWDPTTASTGGSGSLSVKAEPQR